MAEKKKKPPRRPGPEKSPVVWLTVYEAARRQGNLALSNRARGELQKLGVVIQEGPQ
jgi:hypothetical protein